MKKTMLAGLVITLFSMLLLNGCMLLHKNPPPKDLKQFKTIVVSRFATVEATSDMELRVPFDLGEKLSLKFKNDDIKFIYDQSDTLNPVGKELEKNNTSANDLFTDPKLAAQIGKALGADIIIVGLVEKPRFKLDDSDKQYTLMGRSTTMRYTLHRQSAIMDVKLQIIDTKSGELIWDGLVKGCTKYIKAFQAQTPERNPVAEEVIVAQLRDHIVTRVAHTLFPTDFVDRPYPELKEKPKVKLMDSGGVVQYK